MIRLSNIARTLFGGISKEHVSTGSRASLTPLQIP
jgi:hypothetical protein